jgi:hypothetical protein
MNNIDPDDFERLTEALLELNKTMSSAGSAAGGVGRRNITHHKLLSDTEKADKELADSVRKGRKILSNLDKQIEETTNKISVAAKQRDLEIAQLKLKNDADSKARRTQLQNEKYIEEVNKKIEEESETLVKLSKQQTIDLANAKKELEWKKVRFKIDQMLADKTGTALKALSATGKYLNSTLLDSTKGMGKYGDGLSSMGNGIESLLGMFGPFGKALGFAASGLFNLVGASLKQNEVLNDTYEKLSEFGQVDVSGIQGMFNNLQKAGMTVAEIGKYAEIITSVSPQLASLGNSAADGAKILTDSFSHIKNTGVEKQFRMLGFTSESLFKTFANYEGLMGRMGFMQGKSTTQIAKESAEYVKTLDQMSKLTGESRDALQAKMDADASDLKFRLKLTEVDDVTRARLQKASVLMSEFGEESAAGFREMIANNGAVVGEASQKLAQSTGGASTQITKDLLAGKITSIEAARLIALAKEKFVKQMSGVGKVSSEVMAEMGITAKDLDGINKYRGKTQDQVEALDKAQQQQMQTTNDSQRAAEVVRKMTERNFEQAKDRMIELVGKQVTGAFEKLMTIVNAVGHGLASFVKFITFGAVDMTDLFESVDDVKKSLADTTSQLLKTNNALDINAKAQETYNKAKEASDANLKKQANLEDAISKETNKGKRKQLVEELKLTRREGSLLQAEANNALLAARHAKGEKARLLKQQKELQITQASQQKKVNELGGGSSADQMTPREKELKAEAEKLADDKLRLDEAEKDASQLLYQATLKELKFTDADLKNAELAKKFDDAYAAKKKEYADKKIKVDQRLIAIGEEQSKINLGKVSVGSSADQVTPREKELKAEAEKLADEKLRIDKDEKDASKLLYQATLKELKFTYQDLKNAELAKKFDAAYAVKTKVYADKKIKVDQRLIAIGEEQSKIKLGKVSGGSDAASGTSGSSADQMTPKAMPPTGAVGPPDLGNKKIEDIIDFTGNSGDKDHFKKLNQTVANAFTAMAKEYFETTGKKLQINSAYRSDEEQKNVKSTFGPKASVGHSLHNKGQAIDLNSEQVQSLLKGGYLNKYGFSNLDGDPPHIQMARDGGLFDGPTSGYPVMLHGKEVIKPMPAADLAQSVDKQPLSSLNSATASSNSDNTVDMLAMLSDKFDTMIDYLRKSHNTQADILTYTKA